VLKNISRGDELEKNLSKIIHDKYIPVLISSHFLRSKNCGQIDISVFRKGKLVLYEVKNTPECISFKQRRRLNQSLELLCHVFNVEGSLEIKSDCQRI